MLPNGPIKRVSYMEEEAKAWEECEHCEGTGIDDDALDKCQGCHGKGGRWHEAVSIRTTDGRGRPIPQEEWFHCVDDNYFLTITKSSILVRRWKVCGICGGGSRKFYFHGQHQTIGKCPHCEGTGCEPDSQGDWKVKK